CFVFTKQKIIWYQQTWHTIEFSNNKHSRHRIPNPKGSSCFAPEQLFKLTRLREPIKIDRNLQVKSDWPPREQLVYFGLFPLRQQIKTIQVIFGCFKSAGRVLGHIHGADLVWAYERPAETSWIP
ncbi:hypothetical protein, partial [Arthrobacter sp. AG1021]